MSAVLAHTLVQAQTHIERWFAQAWKSQAPPFYSSVDVRDAGFKIAPVDTNLFPGGWNNLAESQRAASVTWARAAIDRLCPGAQRLLLIAEHHTRNPHYLRNLASLQEILQQAGVTVRLGSLDAALQAPLQLELPEGGHVRLEAVQRIGDRVGLEGFDPDLVLLNNDLSAGTPERLQALQLQPLAPPLNAGWSVRRKSRHFDAYAQVAAGLADALGLDPWWLSPQGRRCSGLDFSTSTGLEALCSSTDELLQDLRLRYRAHGIHDRPFVVIKADNGTYGMGIMTVHDAAELRQLNRRTRNKMSVIKDGQTVSEVLVQEGVPTRTRVQSAVAEPVFYLFGAQVVGGFYRVHASRGVDENLNAPGAHFEPLERDHLSGPCIPPQLYAHAVVARLAVLAASNELTTPSCLTADWPVPRTVPLCESRAPVPMILTETA